MQGSRREYLKMGAAAAMASTADRSAFAAAGDAASAPPLRQWKAETDAGALVLKPFMSIQDERYRLCHSVES